MIAPIVLFGRRVRALSRESQDRLGDAGAEVDEVINAVRTVQAFNQEAPSAARFAARVEAALAASMRRVGARSALAAVVILLVFGAVGTILWIGGHDMLAGRISAGELSAFVFYAVVVAASISAALIRPCGPLPTAPDRRIPACRAMRRASGVALILSTGAGIGAALVSDAPPAPFVGAEGLSAPDVWSPAAPQTAALPVQRASGAPTGTVSPLSTRISIISPSPGASISLAILSVSTTNMT